MRVCVVVLGDLGRSPRMQYHAEALAAEGACVDLVGTGETPLPAWVTACAGIRVHALAAPPSLAGPGAPRWRYLLAAALKGVLGGLALLRTLLRRVRKPDVLLVQTPPALPTLPVAWLAARLRGARLVVDWHNFGWSMLALGLGARHPAVGGARWLEGLWGRRADAHLCVSHALREALISRWSLREPAVLYDRAAARFQPLPAERRRALRRRFAAQLGAGTAAAIDAAEAGTDLALVVCPTSWSADEDMPLLLEATALLERRASGADSSPSVPLPPLLVAATGRGPRRAAFEAALARMQPKRVFVRTLWLEAEDYALLLGCADLGLCLHRSASGLDLPMKLADMHGAGLPVLALDYGACLAERLRHGENGLLFSTAPQLADRLEALLGGFPQHTPALDRLRRGLAEAPRESWAEGWRREAAPVLRGTSS